MSLRDAIAAVLLSWMQASAAPLLAEDRSAHRDRSDTPANVRVQFQDDFSYATGGRQSQLNGRDPESTGEIHCSMYTYGRPHRRSPGLLELVMTEDDTVAGPDGEAGVLRMEIAHAPFATDYAGFVILGNRDSGDITMPDWTPGNIGDNELNRTFITFRFRAENRKDPKDHRVELNFRFEPEMEGSFDHGVDFGTLVATRRWRTFRRPLGSAKNLDAFLAAVNRVKPERYKLVWSQYDPIGVNQSGDSLLIDDLKITLE